VAVAVNVKVSARSSKVAIATELPNTSWIQRSCDRLRFDLEVAGAYPANHGPAGARMMRWLAERDWALVAINGLVVMVRSGIVKQSSILVRII